MGTPALKMFAINTDVSATIVETEMSMLPRIITSIIGNTIKALSRKFIGAERNVFADRYQGERKLLMMWTIKNIATSNHSHWKKKVFQLHSFCVSKVRA